jgi:hypothetical protein
MNQDLKEVAEQLKKDYMRKWRANNKDKIRKSTEKYWIKKAEQTLKGKDHEQPEDSDK